MVQQVKNAMVKSWRTSAAGLLTGIAILAHQATALLDNDPATVFSIEAVITALGIIGVGLTARDNGVTSEAAGAKKPE